MKLELSKPRLPMEAVMKLRKGGGAHSSPKGKRGYDRNREKSNLQKEVCYEQHGPACYPCGLFLFFFFDILNNMTQPLFNREAWSTLVKKVYELVLQDIEEASQSDTPEEYWPKLVIGYEFFRLLRGEGFHASRPNDMGGQQKEFYEMEDDLMKRLKELSQKLSPNDSKTKFYIDEAKKSFDVPF